MDAPMLARAPRRGHINCDCHDGAWGSGSRRRARQKVRRAHKSKVRAAEKRAWKRDT